MAGEILFPTFNVSLPQAIAIVKGGLDDPDIPFKTKALAIGKVAEMETHNSITKDELINALRWIYRCYDFEEG